MTSLPTRPEKDLHEAPSSLTAPPGTRLSGFDLARGVAVVLMIQTHAYDGWVLPEARTHASFLLTRLLGTLPLPLFLLLAGVSLSLRNDSLAARGESAVRIRRRSIRAGLEVLLAGYALNVAYGLMDGANTYPAFLRADVLHAIGLSLVLLSVTCIGRALPLRSAAALLGAAAFFACPLATQAARGVEGPVRYLLAPFVEIPGITRMPVVPLLAWCALGVWLAPRLVEASHEKRSFSMLAWSSIAAIVVGYAGMEALVARGVVPSRAHPIIFVNGLDLAGRAVLCTLVCLAWTSEHAARVRGLLCLLGRHSLFVYALHLPFCYGAPARLFKRTLTMPEATLLLVCLVTFCVLATALLEARANRKRARSANPHGN